MKKYERAEIKILYNQVIFTQYSSEKDVIDDPYGESDQWWEKD